MKILFRPFKKSADYTGQQPIPAIKKLPDWYADIPTFVGGDKKFKRQPDGGLNATIKWCNPFLDSLSVGYLILLETDLQVYKQDGVQQIVWSYGTDVVSTHDVRQLDVRQIPVGFSDQPFKFMSNWSIQTPTGYSALFTHPLNRAELPFHTLSGFVETDTYTNPVNFPFLLRSDFEGIIPAGTPIAQVIPIKRESWSHSFAEYDQDYVEKTNAVVHSKIYRSYKGQFWKRKQYK
jgi:hypothetical protein